MTNKEKHDVFDEYFDAVIVIAENEDEARKIHPDPYISFKNDKWVRLFSDGEDYEVLNYPVWPLYGGAIDVKCIGSASSDQKKGVVLSSYNVS